MFEDLLHEWDGEEAVVRLRDIIVSGTEETELQVDDLVTRAVRVDGLGAMLGRLPQRRAEAAKLQRRTAADRHLDWEPAERRVPDPLEVEIAVEATGLGPYENFGAVYLEK